MKNGKLYLEVLSSVEATVKAVRGQRREPLGWFVTIKGARKPCGAGKGITFQSAFKAPGELFLILTVLS